MVVVRSDIAEKGQKYIQELSKQVDAAVYRAAVRTGLVGESRVKGIMEREAFDTGRLLRSVTTQIIKGNDQLRLLIGSNLDYALFVEEGRKPGKWPNVNDLVGWVARKLRKQGINARVNVTFDQLKQMAKSKKKSGEISSQAKIARQHLAALYLIGRKIATKGIRQKLIFKRIEDGLLRFFRAEVQKEIDSLQ